MVELEHIMYIGEDRPVASGGSFSSTPHPTARHFSTTAKASAANAIEADLRSLTRRELQAKAKKNKVKVSGSKE